MAQILEGLFKLLFLLILFIKILAEHKDPALRRLYIETIRRFATPTNRKILEKLLSDSNEEVRSAAQQVAAELEQIRNTSVDELMYNPKGS